MGKVRWLLVWLAALALAGAPRAVREARGAVWNLWALEGGTMAVVCTGTVVETADGPAFLTAGHCVADAPRARYYISQAQDPEALVRVRLRIWEFKGLEAWREGDWAVFTLPEGFGGARLPLCREWPEPGEEVWAWTGPLGMLPILRTGVYSGPIHFPDDAELEEALGGMGLVDIEGAPGSSGSGMLRLEGETLCVWGVWVGAFTRLDGAIVSPFPPVLRGE